MATQTSINIPNGRTPQPDARIALIAEALRYFFATHDAANSDLEIFNRYADELNQEAEDVLDYQVIP